MPFFNEMGVVWINQFSHRLLIDFPKAHFVNFYAFSLYK